MGVQYPEPRGYLPGNGGLLLAIAHMVRTAIAVGIDPLMAIQMATVKIMLKLE